MAPSHQWWSTPMWILARSEGDDFDLRHFEQVRRRELAPLDTGRWEHACASYTVGDQLVSPSQLFA